MQNAKLLSLLLRPSTGCIKKSAVAAAWILAPVALYFGLNALAQGLAYYAYLRCLMTDAGPLSDWGYDTARDISRAITLIAFIAVMFVPLAKDKKTNLRLVALELLGLGLIPIAVQLIGTYAINNNVPIYCGLLRARQTEITARNPYYNSRQSLEQIEGTSRNPYYNSRHQLKLIEQARRSTQKNFVSGEETQPRGVDGSFGAVHGDLCE